MDECKQVLGDMLSELRSITIALRTLKDVLGQLETLNEKLESLGL